MCGLDFCSHCSCLPGVVWMGAVFCFRGNKTRQEMISGDDISAMELDRCEKLQCLSRRLYTHRQQARLSFFLFTRTAGEMPSNST